MKVCLVFTPFASLAYIPLGIAYLKSFVERKVPTCQVRNLDLSNDFYHKLDREAFLQCLDSLCAICSNPASPTCSRMFQAEEFLHWRKMVIMAKEFIAHSENQAFYAPRKYNRLRNWFDLYYGQIVFCLNRILKASLKSTRERCEKFLEENLFREDLERIQGEKPDLVGFSIFSADQLYYALALAKAVKRNVNPIILFGGAFIAHLDRRALLRLFDWVDFIIFKEGELGLATLMRSVRHGGVQSVPNLVYRKGKGIVENKPLALGDIDEIPFPDFSDFPIHQYFMPEPVVSTLFSRGCSWGKCTYCAHRNSYSSPFRKRSIPHLIRELKSYQKRGGRYICFADEMVAARDLERICQAILKENIHIFFSIGARPTEDFTEKLLHRLYEAGCRVINWGVESTSQRILNLMKKGTQARTIEALLKKAYENGLHNVVYLIEGFPTQTEEEKKKDRDFLERNFKFIYDVGVHPFWLEMDTPIFRDPGKYGLRPLQRTCLVQNRRGKLYSNVVGFARKSEKGQGKFDSLIQRHTPRNPYRDQGLYYSHEHVLLHASPRPELER